MKTDSVSSCAQESENVIKSYEISGSHGGEFEDDRLLGTAPCSLVEVDRLFIALMMQTVRISETSVCFNETAWRCNSESYLFISKSVRSCWESKTTRLQVPVTFHSDILTFYPETIRSKLIT
jgi:hypothetical protein